MHQKLLITHCPLFTIYTTIQCNRETYEETGFDINCQLGLTRTFQKEDITWKPLDSNDALFYTEEGTKKRRTW